MLRKRLESKYGQIVESGKERYCTSMAMAPFKQGLGKSNEQMDLVLGWLGLGLGTWSWTMVGWYELFLSEKQLSRNAKILCMWNLIP